MKPNRGQTHFAGVTVSGSLAETVRGCRRWMHERYGCKSGHLTPPHVTLIPPFDIGEEKDCRKLEEALSEFAAKAEAFTALVEGFGSFGDRTLFAQVTENPAWTRWRDALAEAIRSKMPELQISTRTPFIPHVTVSNRDIPIRAIPEALQHFQSMGLRESIPVNHVVLFERVGSLWEIRNGWYCE